MDRRETSDIFRVRLADLHKRSGLRQSAFAAELGIDRSALSQLLNGAGARLPRADTLVALAQVHQVSVDWLLGLSEDQSVMSETRDILEIAGGADTADQTPLAQWHEEARGMKIRYVPSLFPDLLSGEPMDVSVGAVEGQSQHDGFRREYLRLSETDIEVAMPRQRFEALAKGQGAWGDMPAEQRRLRLQYMEHLIRDMYPSLRVFLFDENHKFSMPYTIFGHHRVAVYAGEIYLLLNSRQTIQTMVEHFDNLVRAADTHAHEVADFVGNLAREIEN